MIERQFLAGAAILANETVAQKNVEPREGGMAGRLYVCLERNDGGKTHLKARASHCPLIMRNDVHPIEENCLDRILPGPERERVIAQRPEIGIEHERRTGFRRNHRLAVNRQIWHLARIRGRRLYGLAPQMARVRYVLIPRNPIFPGYRS